MTVLLVILTFAAFLLMDHLFARRPASARHAHVASAPAVAPEPVWVAGYQLPESLHYHPGHTWASVQDGDTVAVGMDDFARRLLGPARAVALPGSGPGSRRASRSSRSAWTAARRGSWPRSRAKSWRRTRRSRIARASSPTTRTDGAGW